MAWIDFDNDGYLDLYQANGRVMRQSHTFSEDPFAEPNLLFRGSGGRFEEILPRGGTREGPGVIAASHLESVPRGGNYDGAAGVIAGLVALDALRREGFAPKRDLSVMAIRAYARKYGEMPRSHADKTPTSEPKRARPRPPAARIVTAAKAMLTARMVARSSRPVTAKTAALTYIGNRIC